MRQGGKSPWWRMRKPPVAGRQSRLWYRHVRVPRTSSNAERFVAVDRRLEIEAAVRMGRGRSSSFAVRLDQDAF